MTPVGFKQFSLLPTCYPHSPARELRIIGLGMEAEPTGAQRAFFRRSFMTTCLKCSGFLVSAPSPLHLLADYFIDSYDLKDPIGEAVQCLNCGYYADAVTVMNRAKQVNAQRLVAQAEGWAKTHSVIISTMEGFHHASTDMRRTIDAQDSLATAGGAVEHGRQTELFGKPCGPNVL